MRWFAVLVGLAAIAVAALVVLAELERPLPPARWILIGCLAVTGLFAIASGLVSLLTRRVRRG